MEELTKKQVKRSKTLSYLLRHHPEEFNCSIDEFGWVSVNEIIANTDFTLEELQELVKKETRYTFSEDYKMIRAFHGHSIKGIHYMQETNPPEILYHGTSEENRDKILISGAIKPMNRTQVHLSDNEEKASKIGARHGKPYVIKINAKRMSKDGIKFYESGDGVWLTSEISVKYFC